LAGRVRIKTKGSKVTTEEKATIFAISFAERTDIEAKTRVGLHLESESVGL
jgi:hypothetical protein